MYWFKLNSKYCPFEIAGDVFGKRLCSNQHRLNVVALGGAATAMHSLVVMDIPGSTGALGQSRAEKPQTPPNTVWPNASDHPPAARQS